MTADLRKLDDKIAKVRNYRSLGQTRNFLLGGESGMGKTTYAGLCSFSITCQSWKKSGIAFQLLALKLPSARTRRGHCCGECCWNVEKHMRHVIMRRSCS